MELNFDVRGNLKSYNILEISIDTFQTTFVDGFEEEIVRQSCLRTIIDSV